MKKNGYGLKKGDYIPVVIFLMLFIFISIPVFAHKVILYSYVDSNMIAVEGGFSDGSPAKNAELKVYDLKGNMLYEGNTDEKGLHRFKIPKRCDLKVVLNAGMGHRAENIIKKEELTVISNDRNGVSSIDERQLRSIIREELVPISKNLAHLNQKGPGVDEILGGIGYIFGLMGIILYFKSKRNDI